MKYAACVVLYNPEEDIIDHISSYPKFISKLYIIDNSSVDNSQLFEGLKLDYQIEYHPFLDNLGIAKALKEGARLAIQDQFDYLLTMDQDSKFPKDQEEILLKYLEREDILNEYGILGINYLEKEGAKEEIITCKYWLTSGNFLNLKHYQKTKGFDESLFIDYVDLDIGHEFFKLGLKVGYLDNISLIHTIGNPIKKKFFGKEFTCMNHSPIRYYYRYRNNLYLYQQDKKFYKEKYYHDITLDVMKLVLFEPNKKNKLKMIKNGRKDAKRGILGKYKGE